MVVEKTATLKIVLKFIHINAVLFCRFFFYPLCYYLGFIPGSAHEADVRFLGQPDRTQFWLRWVTF